MHTKKLGNFLFITGFIAYIILWVVSDIYNNEELSSFIDKIAQISVMIVLYSNMLKNK